ncbi:MAG: DNA replication/repair protein RecF [Lachnospiraceae bacterium]|nr:DNA replication/repair protein RecF [Lachnospiraceae bacterium]
MIIERLELDNYRNYEKLELDFSDKTNIFYGDNAQGKTNILEAVFICCTTKSHKRSKDSEIIRFGEKEAHIRLFLKKNNIDYKIDMHLRKSAGKFVAINSVPIRAAVELMGVANIVFFSPEDLNIIKNGPSERRRFVDMELCQLNKIYLEDISKYNKCLLQRNKLLKDISFGNTYLTDTLDVWDMQLFESGKNVIKYRDKFIKEMNEIIKVIHSSLSGGREELELIYEPNTSIEDFEKKLSSNRNKDIKMATTTTGPHRDDMNFVLNGVDLRKYGSQGQQRTAALSLKLSEIEIVKRMIRDDPILLLDDVLSELDENRQKYLLESIGGIQTLITCTGIDDFIKSRIDIDKTYKVVNGRIEE